MIAQLESGQSRMPAATAPAAKVRRGLRQSKPRQAAEEPQRGDQPDAEPGRRHMAGDGKGDNGGKRQALPRRQAVAAKGEQIEREHRGGEPDIGQQLPGEPGQAGGNREQRDQGEGEPWPAAEAERTQAEHNEPCCQRRLHDHHRPERERNASDEEQAVKRGAAEIERADERPLQIAAGVGEDERKTVPQRRRHQHQQHAGA